MTVATMTREERCAYLDEQARLKLEALARELLAMPRNAGRRRYERLTRNWSRSLRAKLDEAIRTGMSSSVA